MAHIHIDFQYVTAYVKVLYPHQYFGAYSLILKLRQSNIGCNICGEYCGVFIYADDILLLSASRPGLQVMVDICNNFAVSRNLKFSTNIDPIRSKTKCILFSKRAVNIVNIAPILLGGVPLPLSLIHI